MGVAAGSNPNPTVNQRNTVRDIDIPPHLALRVNNLRSIYHARHHAARSLEYGVKFAAAFGGKGINRRKHQETQTGNLKLTNPAFKLKSEIANWTATQ
jgi:hypothetical protein